MEAQRPESLEELGEASQRRRLEFGPKGSIGVGQAELGKIFTPGNKSEHVQSWEAPCVGAR